MYTDDYLEVLIETAKNRNFDREDIIKKMAELKLDVFDTKTLLINAVIKLAKND